MDVTAKNRRRTDRTEVRLDALVVTDTPFWVSDALVHDISIFGAGLEGQAVDFWMRDGLACPPQHFFLIDVNGAVAYGAELVWQRRPRLGVCFHSLMIVSEPTTPDFIRAAMLDARAIQLSRRISDRQLARGTFRDKG